MSSLFLDAIMEVQELMRGLAGVRDASDLPKDKAAADLVIACYPATGTWSGNTPEDILGLHNIEIAVHVPFKDVTRAIERTLPFGDLVPRTLFSAIRNGTFTTITTFGAITYLCGGFPWNDEPRFGWRFQVNDVKTVMSL